LLFLLLKYPIWEITDSPTLRYMSCWEMLERILLDEACDEILLDIGMPVQHVRIWGLDSPILGDFRRRTWLQDISFEQSSKPLLIHIHSPTSLEIFPNEMTADAPLHTAKRSV